MSTLRLTMSQALVKFLDNQYLESDGEEIKFVEGVFGIFGHGCVVGIGEALQESDHSLKFYQGHTKAIPSPRNQTPVIVSTAKATASRMKVLWTASLREAEKPLLSRMWKAMNSAKWVVPGDRLQHESDILYIFPERADLIKG